MTKTKKENEVKIKDADDRTKIDNMPTGFERIEDNFFRFEKIGDNIIGKLMNKGTSTKLKIGLYDVLNKATNETNRIAGSQDLDKKMAGVEIGDTVYIELVDFQETTFPNPMKIFSVGVMRKRAT